MRLQAVTVIVAGALLLAPAIAAGADDLVTATPSRALTEGSAADAERNSRTTEHGEVSVAADTGGGYGVSGTVVLQFGDSGGASFHAGKRRGPLWLSPYDLPPPFGMERQPQR